VFVYPDDGDALQIAHLPRETILVIDINKLREGKKGEGFTIDAKVFRDSHNLVFVDEGHKGQGREDSVWKSIQSLIAGIGHPQRRYRGMLIEFSATFGQVAEADHAFDRYAKSVVYDYPYDRFHTDLYGKDFDVRNLQGRPAPTMPTRMRWRRRWWRIGISSIRGTTGTRRHWLRPMDWKLKNLCGSCWV
jgi:hypothetical protein